MSQEDKKVDHVVVTERLDGALVDNEGAVVCPPVHEDGTLTISIEPHEGVSVGLDDIEMAGMVAGLRAVGLGGLDEETLTAAANAEEYGIGFGAATPCICTGVECHCKKPISASFEFVSGALDASAGYTFHGTLNFEPMKYHYTVHQHSVEGRLDKLEDSFAKLLALMVKGEDKQDQETKSAALGGGIGFGKSDYVKQLGELLQDYTQFQTEMKVSDRYRQTTISSGPHFW